MYLVVFDNVNIFVGFFVKVFVRNSRKNCVQKIMWLEGIIY